MSEIFASANTEPLIHAIRVGHREEVLAWMATVTFTRVALQSMLTTAVIAGQAIVLDDLLAGTDHGLDEVRQEFLRVGVRHGLGVNLPILWEGTAKQVDEHRCRVLRYAVRDDRHGPAAMAVAEALAQTTPERAEARSAHLLNAATIALTYDAWAAVLPLIQAPGFPCTADGLAGDFWEGLDELGQDAPETHQDIFLALGPASVMPRLMDAQRARQRAHALVQHLPSLTARARARI